MNEKSFVLVNPIIKIIRGKNVIVKFPNWGFLCQDGM